MPAAKICHCHVGSKRGKTCRQRRCAARRNRHDSAESVSCTDGLNKETLEWEAWGGVCRADARAVQAGFSNNDAILVGDLASPLLRVPPAARPFEATFELDRHRNQHHLIPSFHYYRHNIFVFQSTNGRWPQGYELDFGAVGRLFYAKTDECWAENKQKNERERGQRGTR